MSAWCTFARERDARAQYPYGPAPPQPVQQMQQSPYGNARYSSPPPGQGQGSTNAPAPRHDEDSGRGLEFFYARAGVGGGLASMGALSAPERVKLGSGIGGAFELALGVRLLVFTLGPRARFMVLSDDKTLWQLGAEAAFHIPLGRFEPFVGMQGGYTFGSSSTQYKCAGACPSRLSFGGADVGLGGGADYYLTPQLSLGGAANVMFLFLSRKAVDGSPDPAFASSESMIGLGATLGVHAAFHL